MSSSISHPDGTILEYVDAMGRTQHSVDGPKGHILVTREQRTRDSYRVWRSDSLGGQVVGPHTRAIKTACVMAGLDPSMAVFA